MQKLLLALCLLFGACQSTVAQNYQGLRSQTFTATTSSSAIRNISSGISYHKLTWIPSGTVSSCSVKLDRSADGSSWSDLIAATSCTTGGMSAITAGTHNYVRITVSTFTGTGSVNVTWTGYINDPQPIDADDVVSADGWVNGHYPKASSNVFVESTLGASGTGACGAGQFVKTLNADAAPTCDTPAGGGDSVTVATTAATDPDFTQAGQVDFTLDTGATPDTIRADIEDGAVVNADINASAAIALSKLASTCPNSGAFVRCIYKTATDTIQSDDTPNLDDELIFPVGANDVWIIQVNLLMALTTNGDVSFDIDVPAGGVPTSASAETNGAGQVTTIGTTDVIRTLTTQWDRPSGTNSYVISFTMRYVGGGTAGNVTIMWSQDTSVAEDISMLVGSHMVGWRIQ